jgi:2,3-bisphosphoglycerate-dependent phosphoglycerate mutase
LSFQFHQKGVQTVERAQFIGNEVVFVNGFKEQKLSEGPVEDFNIAITKV